jgi:hypothetical protein
VEKGGGLEVGVGNGGVAAGTGEWGVGAGLGGGGGGGGRGAWGAVLTHCGRVHATRRKDERDCAVGETGAGSGWFVGDLVISWLGDFFAAK